MGTDLDIHSMVEVVSLAVASASFIINAMIKMAQGKVKEDLQKQISDHQRHLEVHAAKDEEKFTSINEKLDDVQADVKTILRNGNSHR